MTRPYAVASPVARLISIRSARRRADPRVTSTLPVATSRLSAPACSKRSATIVTSPPAVWTVTGACACAADGKAARTALTSRRIDARARVISDQPQRARDTDDRGGGSADGERQGFDRRSSDVDARDGGGHEGPQGVRLRGPWVRGRDQDEPVGHWSERRDDAPGVLVAEDPQHERDAAVRENLPQRGR